MLRPLMTEINLPAPRLNRGIHGRPSRSSVVKRTMAVVQPLAADRRQGNDDERTRETKTETGPHPQCPLADEERSIRFQATANITTVVIAEMWPPNQNYEKESGQHRRLEKSATSPATTKNMLHPSRRARPNLAKSARIEISRLYQRHRVQGEVLLS